MWFAEIRSLLRTEALSGLPWRWSMAGAGLALLLSGAYVWTEHLGFGQSDLTEAGKVRPPVELARPSNNSLGPALSQQIDLPYSPKTKTLLPPLNIAQQRPRAVGKDLSRLNYPSGLSPDVINSSPTEATRPQKDASPITEGRREGQEMLVQRPSVTAREGRENPLSDLNGTTTITSSASEAANSNSVNAVSSGTPTLTYNGPNEGDMVWTGTVEKNQLIEIINGRASAGTLNGSPFPGRPIAISINNTDKLAVVSQPNPLNRFSQAVFRSSFKGSLVLKIHWHVLN